MSLYGLKWYLFPEILHVFAFQLLWVIGRDVPINIFGLRFFSPEIRSDSEA